MHPPAAPDQILPETAASVNSASEAPLRESPVLASSLPQTPITDPRSPLIVAGSPRLPVLKALTSIRFFAALHVALYHFVRPFAKWGVLAAFMGSGYEGVSFFFVLSGFILTYAHAAEYERGAGDRTRFWVARFARIYPVYLLAMIVAALTDLRDFRNPIHLIAYAADLVLMQAWSMRMVNFFHSGAWTLSCEAFFYFIFPFVLMFLRPRTRRGGLGWIAVFYALAIAAPLVCLRVFPLASLHEPFVPVPGDSTSFLISRLPLFAVPEFLAGMSIAWLYLRFRPSVQASAWMAYAGAALLLGGLFFADRLPYLALHNGLLLPAYGLLLLGLSQANGLTSLLSHPWLILLGEASFALYLFHSIVLSVTQAMGVADTFVSAAWRLAIAIPLSVLLHLYVERPCRRAILAWWTARHSRGNTRPATA